MYRDICVHVFLNASLYAAVACYFMLVNRSRAVDAIVNFFVLTGILFFFKCLLDFNCDVSKHLRRFFSKMSRFIQLHDI